MRKGRLHIQQKRSCDALSNRQTIVHSIDITLLSDFLLLQQLDDAQAKFCTGHLALSLQLHECAPQCTGNSFVDSHTAGLDNALVW